MVKTGLRLIRQGSVGVRPVRSGNRKSAGLKRISRQTRKHRVRGRPDYLKPPTAASEQAIDRKLRVTGLGVCGSSDAGQLLHESAAGSSEPL